MASIAIGIRSIGMSSIGQRRVNTRVEEGSISLRLSISRPLAKMVVGSKGVRGGTIGVGCAITVGEGSIGQRRVGASVKKGSISLRLSISRPLAKVVVGVRRDTIAVGEDSIGMSSIGQ